MRASRPERPARACAVRARPAGSTRGRAVSQAHPWPRPRPRPRARPAHPLGRRRCDPGPGGLGPALRAPQSWTPSRAAPPSAGLRAPSRPTSSSIVRAAPSRERNTFLKKRKKKKMTPPPPSCVSTPPPAPRVLPFQSSLPGSFGAAAARGTEPAGAGRRGELGASRRRGDGGGGVG